jgi:hypothetical protein
MSDEVAQSPSTTTAPAPTPGGKEPPAVRYIPGAPPPAPASKSAKKKRSRPAGAKKDEEGTAIPNALSAALVDTAPSESDVKEGSVAHELIAIDAEKDKKPPSHIVELINKRIRPLKKKIVSALILTRAWLQGFWWLTFNSFARHALPQTRIKMYPCSMRTRKMLFPLFQFSKLP